MSRQIQRLKVRITSLRLWIRNSQKRYYYNPALQPLLDKMLIDLAKLISEDTNTIELPSEIYNYLKGD